VKIAIVGPAHPYKGGVAQHTTALAHRLSATGHDTMLVSWRAQYPKLLYPGQLTVAEPEAEPYPGVERPLAWYRPDGWWLTGRRLARQGCDVVVLSVVTPVQAPAYLTLARAARAGGCTVVALCHNVLPHESRGADEPLMRALLRGVDAVIVHSGEQAALAETLTTAPVQVAALPLHLPRIAPGPAEAAPARAAVPAGTAASAGTAVRAGTEAAAWPASPAAAGPRQRLLFFGIVRRYKGLDILLRALAEAGPQISLTVAGEIWDGREELLRLVSDLGLQDRVTMSGGYVPTAGIPAVFAGADALVLPYRSATASQNALVAFQFGLPVIASRAGAIADAVDDGINGILCTPGDAADLARAIRALYQPGMLERLRAGVRRPDPGPLWDDYLAAVGKAASAAPFPAVAAAPFLARAAAWPLAAAAVPPPAGPAALPPPGAATSFPAAAAAPFSAGVVALPLAVAAALPPPGAAASLSAAAAAPSTAGPGLFPAGAGALSPAGIAALFPAGAVALPWTGPAVPPRAASGRPPRPSQNASAAQARSPIVSTSRETTATTIADPRGMTGARAAMKASSRGPTPPGNGMRTNPTDQASAYAPAAIGSTLTPLPVTPATSSQECTLKNAHPASDQAAARSTPGPLIRRSSGGRLARRSARSRPQPITGGYKAISAGGASASAHQYWRAAAPELSGSATAATSSPVARVTSIATTVADALRRRGTSYARAS